MLVSSRGVDILQPSSAQHVESKTDMVSDDRKSLFWLPVSSVK